jgi:hypothetical protein
MMEADNNPFPEFDLGIVDRAKNIGRRLLGLATYYPPTYRGVAEMLDHHLDEPMDGEAMEGYAEVADQLLLPFDKDAAVLHYIALAKHAQATKDEPNEFGCDK